MIDGGEYINIVSYGGGANSTALLVGLHQHRIPVDLILFADTIISNLYLKEYYQRRNRVIANYYFNKENAYDFFADTE